MVLRVAARKHAAEELRTAHYVELLSKFYEGGRSLHFDRCLVDERSGADDAELVKRGQDVSDETLKALLGAYLAQPYLAFLGFKLCDPGHALRPFTFLGFRAVALFPSRARPFQAPVAQAARAALEDARSARASERCVTTGGGEDGSLLAVRGKREVSPSGLKRTVSRMEAGDAGEVEVGASLSGYIGTDRIACWLQQGIRPLDKNTSRISSFAGLIVSVMMTAPLSHGHPASSGGKRRRLDEAGAASREVPAAASPLHRGDEMEAGSSGSEDHDHAGVDSVDYVFPSGNFAVVRITYGCHSLQHHCARLLHPRFRTLGCFRVSFASEGDDCALLTPMSVLKRLLNRISVTVAHASGTYDESASEDSGCRTFGGITAGACVVSAPAALGFAGSRLMMGLDL